LRLAGFHGAPQPLEVVKGSQFGSEDVDDHGAQVQEYPARVGVALDAGDAQAGTPHSFHDAVSDRAGLDFGTPRGQYERIGDDRPALERQGQDVFGFLVERGFARDIYQVGQTVVLSLASYDAKAA
jgi:hypothetical protein